MRKYLAKELEFAKEGFTDLMIVETADMVPGFSNRQVTLTNLAVGDAVLNAMIDVVTIVTGPTGAPTGQIKVITAAKAITPTCVLNSASVAGTQPDNTVVGSAMIQTGTDTVALDLQVGGGNGAAATAGEIWCWLTISRKAMRTIQA